MVCSAYQNEPHEEWKQINGENYDEIMAIGKIVEKRHTERKYILNIFYRFPVQ